MKYELAKELKDAGFKQGIGNYLTIAGEERALVYDPTLSELVEACMGSNDDKQTMSCLKRVYADDFSGRIVWQASTGTYDNASEGGTPEEAVARLWLALNK